MFVYWAIFVVLAAGALLNQQAEGRRGSLIFIALASVPTALMIGLRWEIGPDWDAYLEIYGYTKPYSLAASVAHPDAGYFTLMWVLHQAAAPFWVLNLVCGVVLVAGLTAFASRQPNPWLAFLVAFPYLVIVVGMSGNRQSIALGLMFFALNAFERERLVRFALLLLVAAIFHGSVLLLLPFCLMSHTRNNLQSAALLAIAGILGVYLSRDAFSVYARRYVSVKIQSTGVAYRLAMNAMAALVFLLFRRRFIFTEHQARLWRNMSLCTLALIPLLLVLPSSTPLDRFLLYLFPLQFVILSRVPAAFSGERQAAGQFTLLVIAYAALVQIVFLGFGKFAYAYLPYRSVIFE